MLNQSKKKKERTKQIIQTILEFIHKYAILRMNLRTKNLMYSLQRAFWLKKKGMNPKTYRDEANYEKDICQTPWRTSIDL